MEDRTKIASPLTQPGFATVREMIDEIHRDGGRTPEQQLEMLIDRFCTAARAIDPSITRFWVCRGGEDMKQPFFISIERKEGASCIRRGE